MEQLTKQILGETKPSDLKKVRINIESDYKWSRGWTAIEEERFNKEVIGKLQNIGKYEIIKPKSIGTSPTLKLADKYYDNTNVYLHPMEFTGYARYEDILQCLMILNECSFTKVIDTIIEDVYDISDEQYTKMLFENSYDIVELAKHMYPLAPADDMIFDFPLNFIHGYRIPRVGDSFGVIGSSDTDWKAIENILIMAKQFHMI